MAAPPLQATACLYLPVARKLTMGCHVLDGLLRGGLVAGSLTELVGESTAGKTQLCLQLLLTVQRPLSQGGLDGAAIYIHTEGPAALARLRQLAAEAAAEASDAVAARGAAPGASAHAAPGASDAAVEAACDRIFLTGCSGEPEDLFDVLLAAESLLAAPQHRVRLLIVDSIAALFRGADAAGRPSGEPIGRAEILFRMARLLKTYASRYNLCVLVTNHVVSATQAIGSSGAAAAGGAAVLTQVGNARELRGSQGPVTAALGLAWANCATTRLYVARRGAAGGEGPGAGRRRLQVLLAPHLPPGEIDYVIGPAGVRGVPPPGEEEWAAA